jgi:ribosomal protein S18 acetylase RimI-like enzyme
MGIVEIRRATIAEDAAAYEIVEEYYEKARVVARDSREEFAQFYFGEGGGVWLAVAGSSVVGCIALRALPQLGNCGELKRLYVQSGHRGKGIANALLAELEKSAAGLGYEWLYLDTAGNMTAAKRFYEARGYQQCDRYNNNPQAAVFMRKKLAASR